MAVEFNLKNISTDQKHGVRKQVVPVSAAKAKPIKKVTELVLNDDISALLDKPLHHLLAAEAKVGGIVKIIMKPDDIAKKLVEILLTFNSAVSLNMARRDSEIAELAQLHIFILVLCAPNRGDDMTFPEKCEKIMDSAVL
ncbi:uncharacterized protein PHALS_06186 [Plasmopara halstedii]|uniref:Uncharacterized protein n=1 Tax=Plasmopara halstedii TaxID=4781 RepID=A0A0P1B453_PLAHL|nr:uncharacterized protein PHALS_06186 [Plasmopara halstedii]CEG48360.1 hypothetical protein PHALS_06186 [Plasmopara halstedii]|eukprot:XP_024584729.1 hypothetical protein PHALS_06186 [Plasmopara halstedii]